MTRHTVHEHEEKPTERAEPREPLPQHTETETERKLRDAMDKAKAAGDDNAYEAARARYTEALRNRARLGEQTP